MKRSLILIRSKLIEKKREILKEKNLHQAKISCFLSIFFKIATRTCRDREKAIKYAIRRIMTTKNFILLSSTLNL